MIADRLKRNVVANPLAQFGLRVGARLNLVYSAFFRVAELGTRSNDFLAWYLVVRMCEPGKVFVDIGAHIGSIIAAVRAHVPRAQIIAIEPIPEKADHLRQWFPSVEVHQVAAGAADTSVTFFVDVRRSGLSSLSPFRDGRPTKEIIVAMIRLDQILSSRAVDVVKIDVEGAELEVMRGALDTIKRDRPILVYESGPPISDRRINEKAYQWDFLKSNEYAVVVPNRLAHDDGGLSMDAYLDSHVYPRRTTNYFAVPFERRTEYRDRARRLLSIA